MTIDIKKLIQLPIFYKKEKNNPPFLVKQGDSFQFQNKTIIFHFEYTSVCNQKCSYCLEGNYSPLKKSEKPSKKEDLLNTVDKIFDAYDKNVNLIFIHVGGEPTQQPYFIDVVKKIKKRENTHQILTTNFTKSIEYYRNLGIYLVTSMHLDFHEPITWLNKTLELNDLILETRIMAHPQKMKQVKEAYELFLANASKYSLNFSLEEILDFKLTLQGQTLEYKANYDKRDYEWLKSHSFKKQNQNNITENKQNKCLKHLFYGSQWTFSDNTVKEKQHNLNKFKGWFCERSIIIIRPNGSMIYGWGCTNSKHNIYKEKKFPKKDICTVICDKENCPLNFAETLPKYKIIKFAPKYKNKFNLVLKRLEYNIKSIMPIKFYEQDDYIYIKIFNKIKTKILPKF